MKIIAEAHWSWQLFQDGAEYYLSVVCGSVGLYTRDILLTPSEAAQYNQAGERYLHDLAQSACSLSSQRHLADFAARPDVIDAIAVWRSAG